MVKLLICSSSMVQCYLYYSLLYIAISVEIVFIAIWLIMIQWPNPPACIQFCTQPGPETGLTPHFPLRSIINREQHENYPYNQSSHNRKYTECSIVKMRASFIDFKVGVSLGHGFVLLLVVLDSVPSKE